MISEREDAGVLLAANLPEPGEDRVYQLWLIGDNIRAAGLFRPDQRGLVVEPVVADLSNTRGFGVTIEPRGGSPQPTSDLLLYGKI
ncbi:MAG: anti-sigma factor [Actinomycetota bacterium]|nr:anti-sigma factor [Actinomycetota bacterium]